MGHGQHYYFNATSGTFSAQQNNASSVSIFFQNSTAQFWSLSFGAPDGQPLAPGTYNGATRYPFNGGTGWPGIDIVGNGTGCNNQAGSFVIHEISLGSGNTVNAFHASFVQSCEGAYPPLRGEIFFNATATPPLRNHITSGPIAFATNGQPFRYQIAGSRPETSFSATGLPIGLSVSSKTGLISGTPAAEGNFAVTINANDGVQKASASLQLNVAAPSRFNGLVSALSLVGEPGEWISKGIDQLLTPETGYITASASDDGNSAGVGYTAYAPLYAPFFGAVWWRAGFTAPRGQPLQVGQYVVDPNNFDGPHMDVSGNGSGCSQFSGTFEIKEVQTRTNGQVEHLHATFEQHCDGATQALRGTVWFDAAGAIASPPLAVASVNQPFVYQIVANNNPVSFGATNLPAGLALDPTAGRITGTPTVLGKYQIDLVADAGSNQATDSLTLSVLSTPTPTPTPTPTGAPVMNLSVTPAQINEGEDAVFVVSSSVPAAHDINVKYTVVKGTGVTAGDYVLSSTVGHFTIPAGQTSAAITLHAVRDTIAEGNESVSLKLVNGTVFKLGPQKKATVVIVNVP